MKNNDVNSLLFLTLNNISEIGTPKVSMWSISDRYAYPPYCSFKFKNHDQRVYDKLQLIIEGFEGHFQWGMKKHDHPASSYIIAPLKYLDRLMVDNRDSIKDFFLKEMTMVEYEKMIDAVINEIPILADHISQSMG